MTEPAHHRTDYLRELGRTIEENRELLTTDLVALEELFEGDAKWMNILDLENERTGEQIDEWTINNTTDDIYPYPAPRDACPFGQGTDWRVRSHRREVQPAAVQARNDLEEAKTSANSLDNMTSEDLDALSEIPMVLSRMLGVTRRAQAFFRDGEEAIADRMQAESNDTEYWVGDGSQAYINSMSVQISRFDQCQTDLDVIEQGCLNVSDATVDLAIAISNVYIEKVEEWSEIVSTCISVASGPTQWATYAQRLAKSISSHMTQAAKDFQNKLEELSQLDVTQDLVNNAYNLRMENWPSPTADSLLQ